MRNSGNSGVVDSHGDGSNVLDTGHQVFDQGRVFDVQNFGREQSTVIVDLSDGHTVGEGGDVQHVQKSSFGGTDFLTDFNQVDIRSNFDSTTSNLGGDTESLEERGLSGFHTSVTTGDEDITRGHSTGFSRSLNTVSNDLVTNGFHVTIGKDESNVSFNSGQEFFQIRVIFTQSTQDFTDHGVFTHQDDGFSTERLTNLVHLVGTDIVNAAEENGRVFGNVGLEFLEVSFLFGTTWVIIIIWLVK